MREGMRTVLQGINLRVRPGEKLGILGRNGSGKSTLIRLIGGAEKPSSGRITRSMRVSWPLALISGFGGSLTGRDSLRMVCRIYGVDWHDKLGFVKDFTELGRYFDEPVQSYSHGMMARLAFAVSMVIDFDCFLIDEVVAVGDSTFTERCNHQLFGQRGHKAMVIVSHSEAFIRQHCDHAAPGYPRGQRIMKVLVDLKPALDGYAGIPQECRLLFKGLRQMNGFEVEGLIQHGGRRLRAALPEQHHWSQDKQIDGLSKFVVSMYEKPFDNFAQALLYDIKRRFSRGFLRLRANLGLSLPLSRFEADLFEDFVWRTFFSKTLNADCQAQLMQTRHRVLSVPRQMMHKAGLDGLKFSQTPSYAQIDTKGFDAFVTQNPFPGRVDPSTQMVVRYHDAVPILMPHTTRDKAFDQAAHFHALKDNLKRGAWFSCISHATRNDLLTIFPQAEPRSVVIPNIVSDEYYPDPSPPHIVHQVIRNRVAVDDLVKTKLPKAFAQQVADSDKPMQYLLMVSTIEPRKNHALLIQAWEMLRYGTHSQLKLVVVGNSGWDQGPVLQSFRPWAAAGELFWLNNVPAAELRALYTHAQATVCPGLAEGFDYSGVEAMKCACPVAASDIPVHREIYDQAAVYFNAYSAADASQSIGQLLSPESQTQRDQLRMQGLQMGQRYTENAILPQWTEMFARLSPSKR
eukprot:gene9599-11289_t